MKSLERRIIDFLLERKVFLFILAVTLIGLTARLSMFNHISGDMVSFLIPWMDEFRDGGFKALGTQVGDYNLPYQFIVYLLSLIPGRTEYKIKIVSVVFDILLSYAVMDFISTLEGKKELDFKAALGYAITFLMPAVVLDSAAWGQCDCIYTFFVIITLNLFFKDKIRWAFFFLGIALSFKLQSIFILPFILILYFRDKKFSVVNMLCVLPGLYIPCIPAIIAGRGIFSPIMVYLNQANEYPYMWLNFPSFWNLVTIPYTGYDFIGGGYNVLKTFAVCLTMALLGGLLFYEVSRKKQNGTPKDDVMLLLITMLICVYFLPSMHERYSFTFDVLLIVYMLLKPRAIPLALVCFGISSLTYGHYLFGVYYNIMICAIVYLIVLAIILYVYIRRVNNGRLEEL